MSFFFSDILKNHNYLDIFPTELIFPTALNFLTAFLIALIIYLLRRPADISSKLIAATTAGFLMVNFDTRLSGVTNIFRAITPVLPEPPLDVPIISLLFLVSIFGLSIFAGVGFERLQSKHRQLRERAIPLLFIMLGFIFLGQAFKVVQILPSIVSQSKAVASSLPKVNQVNKKPDKPDIYYIVLDRYTNNEVLKQQLDFNNEKFTNFLQSSGFHINENAHSNYPYTSLSLASTLNGRYLDKIVEPYKDDEIQSKALLNNLIRQSSVIQSLKSQGYKYHSIGSQYNNSNKAPLADFDYSVGNLLTVFNQKKRLHSIEASTFIKSPYYRFAAANISWGPIKIVGKDEVQHAKDQLGVLNSLASSSEQGGRFIFAHITVPHEPYFFNGDSSLSNTPTVDSQGKPIQKKYLGQVEFINNQMEKLIKSIQEHSKGQAVILVNSDEGAWPIFLNNAFESPITPRVEDSESDMRKWSDDWLKMKYGILQAVYIPKATSEDLEYLSSVNLFRILLNRYLGYDLEYLPDCNYALHKGVVREFNHVDITKRLTGSTTKYCTDHQSLSPR